jgi:hypothetical protein
MLEDWIGRHRAEIQRRWFEHITETYPEETSRFLKSQADQFANPVGARLRHATTSIVDGLGDGRPAAELVGALDEILRVRALQEFSPSAAVGFILQLKRVVRDFGSRSDAIDEASLAAFDLRVDELVLAAFDVYEACRDQMYKAQISQIRNRSLKAMERLNEWRARRDGTAGTGTETNN